MPRPRPTKNSRNAAFHTCWDDKFPIYDLVWPNFTLAPAFEISPYCEPFDEECAEKLHFCYNAADCASVLFKSSGWTQVSELWVRGRRLLLQQRLGSPCGSVPTTPSGSGWNTHVPRSSAYRTMDFVRPDLRGFILLDYADGISDVLDADSLARHQCQVAGPIHRRLG